MYAASPTNRMSGASSAAAPMMCRSCALPVGLFGEQTNTTEGCPSWCLRTISTAVMCHGGSRGTCPRWLVGRPSVRACDAVGVGQRIRARVRVQARLHVELRRGVRLDISEAGAGLGVGHGAGSFVVAR